MINSSSNTISENYKKIPVYYYRDYWSNRKKLGLNRKPERLGWKTSEEFDIKHMSSGDLKLEKKVDSSISIIDPKTNTTFSSLADPIDLISQYEPYNITIRSASNLSRTIMKQTPHEFFGLANYSDSKIGGDPAYVEPPEIVQEERLATIKSDLRLFSLNNPLIGFPIYFFIAWLAMDFAPASHWLLKIIIYGSFVLAFIPKTYSRATKTMSLENKRELHIFVLMVSFGFFIILWMVFEYLMPFLYPVNLVLYAYLGLYFIIRIIDEISMDVRKAYRLIFFYQGEKAEDFHYENPKDVPVWLESKPYWVFQYLFLWRGEFTLGKKLPFFKFKPDWERVEVWLDAKTGIIEFLVSDYHWRELWYKIEEKIERVYVWTFPNFHTLRPFTLKIKKGDLLRDLYDRSNQLYHEWHRFWYETLAIRAKRKEFDLNQLIQNEEKLSKIPRPFINLIARIRKIDVIKTTLHTLWWTYCRYLPGSEN